MYLTSPATNVAFCSLRPHSASTSGMPIVHMGLFYPPPGIFIAFNFFPRLLLINQVRAEWRHRGNPARMSDPVKNCLDIAAGFIGEMTVANLERRAF